MTLEERYQKLVEVMKDLSSWQGEGGPRTDYQEIVRLVGVQARQVLHDIGEKRQQEAEGVNC